MVHYFGDPNAQPPTPKQTPTSTGFPSSVFETPKNNRASFDDSSGWTPQFAEEYSVFNSTPGNLKPSHISFADYSVPTPYQASNHKRLLSADSIVAEIATHAPHFSPNPNLPLPPVDPSKRLSSSPNSLAAGFSPTEAGFQSRSQHLSKKGYRGGAQETQGQTATPPPSTHKGRQRLAPKLRTSNMQNDGFEHEFVAGMSQQMPNFISTPTDLFSYPMSAPAAASGYGDSRMFWDTDMGGMDIDFSVASGEMFPASGHRPMNSLDWGKSNEMFQETGIVPSHGQESNPPAKKERALAPKPPQPPLDTSVADTSMFGQSFATSTDESFAMMNQSGSVDPGLLFTRPPSSSMEPASFNPLSQPALMQPFSQPEPIILAAKAPKRGGVRRSTSNKEINAAKKINRASASSPVKSSADRPGLSRSLSEKISRKPISKATSLPNFAPATRPVPQSVGRPAPPGPRASGSGRISPLKNHQQRLSSLSSIPESPAPRTQTSVKFTIDSRGRARAETTTVIINDEDTIPKAARSRKGKRSQGRSWASSEDDDSSTDDEPIIIPSRNTSFALPESRQPAPLPYHSSRRSVSDQSTSSLGIYYNEPDAVDDAESEAETVMNVPGGNHYGDATSELRKVIEDRQKRASNINENFIPRPAPRLTPSPIKASQLRTQSVDRGHRIRCVCNTASNHINGNSYMVQCESCEMWLHGKCINITRQTHPSVYICAFCANTPNAHGMRGREIRRNLGATNPRVPAASPLAHKSFKSFR
ncbi:uncharacterized protein F4812DRAFT_465343 [Daldinia caldariorum]|uniref:uncharacterized protein n=1 Tax=Daldinia caldariorum TaxID=326644 RepID=UPI002007C38E|nr:uncharacterized protein F4812DRAFT_465343 [Daldinia caldariorum]KAI1467286.1 hypothetical protein F4812DRAFT_465343 [Daldinia caldariorum]